jgi:RNA polymerase sigma-70 factor (ECF subfamily)
VCYPIHRPSPGQTEKLDAAELVGAFTDVQEKLFRKLRSLLGNEADAQDALQTAFLNCWRARASVGGLHNPRGWVYRVGVNAGRDLKKYLGCRRSLPLDAASDAVAAQASPIEELLRREEHERLQEAVAQLRPAEREVFVQRQNGTASYEEIARRNGYPVGTAKALRHRALLKLRHQLHASGTN